MPDLESHWFAERLAYLGQGLLTGIIERQKASKTFPRLMSNPKAEGLHRPRGKAPFARECRQALPPRVK